jgi:hypothetical protein
VYVDFPGAFLVTYLNSTGEPFEVGVSTAEACKVSSVCVHGHVYVCAVVCVCVRVCVRVCVFMGVCVYLCMCASVYVYVYVCGWLSAQL